MQILVFTMIKIKSSYYIIIFLLVILFLSVITLNKQSENISSKAFANGYEICLDYYTKEQFKEYNLSECQFNQEKQTYWCYG